MAAELGPRCGNLAGTAHGGMVAALLDQVRRR